MTDFSQRLRQAMSERGINLSTLSAKSGVAKSCISEYLKGKYDPKMPTIAKLATALRVSEEWLSGKDVPMDPDSMQISDDMLKFALFNSNEGITDEMLAEVKAFAEYLKSKKS